MYSEALANLVRMSNTTGSRVDYVQAGGGNTSVKFENGYMAIKASGSLLKQMTDSSGYVVVNSSEMKSYHEKEHEKLCDCNKQAMDLALASIIQINGEKEARPSVEVGFHSVLDKYVLHLHPVYTNILMCSKGGAEKAMDIADSIGIASISVPYTMPGYKLTKLILKALNDYKSTYNTVPKAVFLKNHGIITHAETSEEAVFLIDNINKAIIAELQLLHFPAPAIQKDGDRFKSTNAWMKKVLSAGMIARQLHDSPVYPDQLVYTANELGFDTDKTKIEINGEELYYNTGEKEAIALEETMTALVYVYSSIQERGMELELLSQTDCADILGWDSEKYRKSLISGR